MDFILGVVLGAIFSPMLIKIFKVVKNKLSNKIDKSQDTMKILYSKFFNNKETKVDEFKDTRGRTVHYRTDPSPEEELGNVFQEKMDEDISGRRQKEKDKKLNDVWFNSLEKLRSKKKNKELSMAFVIKSKKK